MFLPDFYNILMLISMFQESQIISLTDHFKILYIRKFSFVIVNYTNGKCILIFTFLHFPRYLIAAMFMANISIEQ